MQTHWPKRKNSLTGKGVAQKGSDMHGYLRAHHGNSLQLLSLVWLQSGQELSNNAGLTSRAQEQHFHQPVMLGPS